MAGLEALNVVLALLGFFAVTGSAAVMTRDTPHMIRIAMLAIGIGLLWQALGEISGQWQHGADTLTFAGIAALLFSSRRVPTCWLERHGARVAGGILALSALAAAYSGLAQADENPAQWGVSPTYTMRDGAGNWVRLSAKPCPKASGFMDLWRAAQMFHNGAYFEACWLRIGTHVLVIDSARDVSPIPLGAFIKDETI